LPASFFVWVIVSGACLRRPPQIELQQYREAIERQKGRWGLASGRTGLKIIGNKKPRSPGLDELTLCAPMQGN
jgi:hypothetical protein